MHSLPTHGGAAATDSRARRRRRPPEARKRRLAASGTIEVSSPFEGIYGRWFEDVARWVRSFGVRAADSEDIAQDVFMIVHRHLSTFDGRNLGGWLYQITRRRVRDYRRLTWVKQMLGMPTLASMEDLLQTSRGPLEDLESTEAARLLQRLLDRLPPQQRVAFVLFEIDGKTGRDIAELQQVTLNAVWTRLSQSRAKLSQAMELQARRASERD